MQESSVGAAANQAELFCGHAVLGNVKRLLLLVGLLLTACGTVPQSHGGPVQDQVSLIDALRKSVTVDITGTLAQPFLHPGSGTTVRLSGGTLTAPADVQLFEYASTAAAAAARQTRADGSTATTIVDWVAPTSSSRGAYSSSILGRTRQWSTF